MSKPQVLIAGNWKMNGGGASLAVANAVAGGLGSVAVRVAICPPATLIQRIAEVLADSGIFVGGQDCHVAPSGAFTGDTSAEQLVDAGAAMVILGHSERRAGHGERDSLVADKARSALRAGLEPIICVGETLDQRKAGVALSVVTEQVRGSLPPEVAGNLFSVAYEPVWAIGTGLTPTILEIEEVHRAIRGTLIELFAEAGAGVAILYGGSVNPSNAAEILRADEVGGALVGGASLKAEDFLKIIRAA